MKGFVILVLLLFITRVSVSQYYISDGNNASFEEVVKKTEHSYKNKDKGKGSGYKQFKRWEDFVRLRTDYTGNIVNNTAMSFAALENLKKRGAMENTRSNGSWTELGPDTWSNNPDPYPDANQGGWNPGNGRINEIAFHPTNSGVVFAGASGGGLWKTNDGGSSWYSVTDGMPNLAISGIAVSHTDPNDVYILTGDGDSRDLSCIGVLKSTDGGNTWNKTFLSFGANQVFYGFELKMNPDSSNHLLASTTNGLWRTTNDGETWVKKSNAWYYDIEYNPSHTDTVYASSNNFIARSIDGGENWHIALDLTGIGLEDSRIELAVTLDNPDKVYAVVGDTADFQGIYVSDDSGDTWEHRFDPNGPNILGYHHQGNDNKSQSRYDLAIAVSPYDEDQIFVGGINIWRSNNGGLTWSIVSHWRQDWADYEYVHADIHELIFQGSQLYAGTDGGVFYSSTAGNSWSDLSEGLRIMQPHKIGISNSNTDLVYLGTQDNGSNKYTGNTTVENVRGADGFECIIRPANNDHVFTSTQYGSVYRSDNAGVTFEKIINSNDGKLFNNPLILRPVAQDRLIVPRWKNIDIHDLNGTLISTKTIPQDDGVVITNITLSEANDNILLASINGSGSGGYSDSLWTTNNLFGWPTIFTNVTSDLPVIDGVISDLKVDPSNANHFIVSFGKYLADNKVFESWNGGSSWNNVSYNLENIPVNCIALDPEVDSAIYIGTDIGVFYKLPGAVSWTYYSNGLPSVIINELEINTNDNLIYAATYGRGLWRSGLYSDCPSSYGLTQGNDPSGPGYTGVQHYEASNYISSTRVIQGGIGTDVHYQASIFIDLKPGFRAYEGNVFRSVIGNCGEVILDPMASENSTLLEDEKNDR